MADRAVVACRTGRPAAVWCTCMSLSPSAATSAFPLSSFLSTCKLPLAPTHPLDRLFSAIFKHQCVPFCLLPVAVAASLQTQDIISLLAAFATIGSGCTAAVALETMNTLGMKGKPRHQPVDSLYWLDCFAACRYDYIKANNFRGSSIRLIRYSNSACHHSLLLHNTGSDALSVSHSCCNLEGSY